MKIAFYVSVGIIGFFIGMKCCQAVYKKGFRDGVDFTLNVIQTLDKQDSYGDDHIR